MKKSPINPKTIKKVLKIVKGGSKFIPIPQKVKDTVIKKITEAQSINDKAMALARNPTKEGSKAETQQLVAKVRKLMKEACDTIKSSIGGGFLK